ncbi:MAG: flagellar biosynthesis repressor FlbT [Acetobacteraceae bacterium]|nr:flagellar biosynthesis repressor FlbT [Acetobacteraceae bacterium]MDW8399591.1 flagellar biosynthesis repressor FlbT [Acetobacteraceae bacterium]
MTTLVLEIRAGELMVVNGTALRFRSRARLELVNRARFLFGKQVMAPEEATTPARRIYFALQTAYVGPEELRERAMAEAHDLVEQFQQATTSALARQLLDRALALAEADEWYPALKNVRVVMRHEAAVLGLPMPGEGPPDPAAQARLPSVHGQDSR